MAARLDCLVQDVDVTWSRDPIPYLRELSTDYETIWMDDGARTNRFAPFFANTGFYYLRNNLQVAAFWDAVLYFGPYSFSYRSNQQTVNMVMEWYATRWGLSVKVLPWQLFPSGNRISMDKARATHRNEPLRKALDEGYVKHYCWTRSIKEKVEKMISHGDLHIAKDCVLSAGAKCPKGAKSVDAICAL